MGVKGLIKSQFIEVIEWTDSTIDTIIYRFPVENKEIKMNAQLTVRESQIAIFMNEGIIADVFFPGRYTLTTENMPVLTKLKSWKYGFNSPFKAEVYYVSTKQFIDQKWGTSNPIMMRDPEFGVIRLRGHGNFSFKILNATKFFNEISGTTQIYDTEKIYGQLKRMIISGVTDVLGEARLPALEIASNYENLSTIVINKLQARFANYGIKLTSLYIENVSLPEEVEKYIDKKTSMGVIGNLQQYTQFQTAEAIREAANNPNSGAASLGVGFGAGTVLGKSMIDNMNFQDEESKILCPHCNTSILGTSKFCMNCGNPLVQENICIKCNHVIDKEAKFCSHCGHQQFVYKKCFECGNEMKLEAKFCVNCGNKS